MLSAGCVPLQAKALVAGLCDDGVTRSIGYVMPRADGTLASKLAECAHATRHLLPPGHPQHAVLPVDAHLLSARCSDTSSACMWSTWPWRHCLQELALCAAHHGSVE